MKYECPACGFETNDENKWLEHGKELYKKVKDILK